MQGIWDSIKDTAQSIRKTLSAAARGLTIRFTEDAPAAPAEEPLRIRIPRSPPRKPPTHPGPPRGPQRSGQTRRARSHSGSSRRRSATPENAARLRRLQAEGAEPVVTEQPAVKQMNRISIPIKQLMKLGHAGLGRREIAEVEERMATYFEGGPINHLLALEGLHRDNMQLYKDTLQNRLAVLTTKEFLEAGSARMSPLGREVYHILAEGIQLAVNFFNNEPIERLLTFDPRSLPAPVYKGAFDTTLEGILERRSLEELLDYSDVQMSPRSSEIFDRVMASKRR